MSEQLKVLEESQEKLNLAFAEADSIIMRKYMPEIRNYPIKEMPSEIANTNINSVLRINKIAKIVYDAEETQYFDISAVVKNDDNSYYTFTKNEVRDVRLVTYRASGYWNTLSLISAVFPSFQRFDPK